MNRIFDLIALKALLEEFPATLLLDVQAEDIFAQGHLPGARNACVYNVTFLDDCAHLASGKDGQIVVYASSDRSRAAAVALEKLGEAGYTSVGVFPGGLEEWLGAGFPVEAGPTRSQIAMPSEDRIFQVDPASSVIRWSGRNFNSIHQGTLHLIFGQIGFTKQAISEARFVIDLLSMQNSDIADPGMRGVLIAHLCSDDFLNTARHPTAELLLLRAVEIGGSGEGQPNYLLYSELTLNGITQPLHFPATLGWNADGRLAAKAKTEIDRTRWGIRYGSNRFYEGVGKHFVSDLIELEILIETI